MSPPTPPTPPTTLTTTPTTPGILVSRIVFGRVRNFLLYRIAATLQLLLFFFIALFSMKPKEYQPDWTTGSSGSSSSDIQNDWPDYFSLPVIATA